jgi:hypothetical protein
MAELKPAWYPTYLITSLDLVIDSRKSISGSTPIPGLFGTVK